MEYMDPMAGQFWSRALNFGGVMGVKWRTMSGELSYSQLRTANEARQSVSDSMSLHVNVD